MVRSRDQRFNIPRASFVGIRGAFHGQSTEIVEGHERLERKEYFECGHDTAEDIMLGEQHNLLRNSRSGRHSSGTYLYELKGPAQRNRVR